MKRITFFMLSALIIGLAACNNQGGKNANNSQTGDFETFWKDFQKMVANNDKEGIMAISSETTKNFFKITDYEQFMSRRMKEEVARANVSNIEDRGDMGMLFMYKEFYEGNGGAGEAMYSTFGFWFKKIDGKWMISEPQAGG